jgi:TATA-box binding protein (TBP) (component of TFIID and TFIIIB)
MSDMSNIDNYNFNATPYRISTITATGSVNSELNLDLFFDEINELIVENGVDKTTEHKYGLIYAEFGKKRSFTYYNAFSKKFILQRKRENTSKRFDNQLTVMYKFNDVCIMNIKIFKNGNIQITGIKNIPDGDKMIDIIISMIQLCFDTKGSNIAIDINKLVNIKYKVALINSDFKVDFEIKRDKLFSILINYYENKCSFEPCIYPGVKIQYFWNKNNSCSDGLCKCNEDCFTGKGDGNGNGDCKKITIAVFQSGCIIITGAQTSEQINDAYKYICRIFNTHLETIKKTIIPQEVSISKIEIKNKIVIKKSQIIYPINYIPPSSISHKRIPM